MTEANPPNDLSSTDGGSYSLPLLLGILLVWRWMLPPEDVLQGGTLWIAQCSLLLPVALSLLWRDRDRRLVWGSPDSALWIIVLGHWMSFAWMLSIGGNLRTGFNLCWEWTAVGTTVFVMRQVVRDQTHRQDLLRLVVLVGIVFAAIGLRQHYISYRTALEDYRELATHFDSLVTKAESIGLSRLEQREFHRLSLQMQEMKIPLQGPGREVFERRLDDNRQPIGRWALANSLGGVLAVTLILIVPGIISPGRARWWSLLILIPVALCLWKTNSRTAWVAAFVGIFFYGLREFSPSDRFYRRSAIGALIAGLMLGGVLLVWGMSSLDRIGVDSHYALRSFQFRLQYWSGSLAMLFDAPIFGVGPGNFREHYLIFKMPASSEQIADPHNSILDLWANGGLAAMAGGLSIAWLVLGRIVKFDRAASPTTSHEPVSEGLLSSPWMLGAEIALLGSFLFTLLTTGEFDKELLAVIFGLPFLDVALQRVLPVDDPKVPLIAAAALGIHLLGAGGTEMPGIVLFGAALLAISATDESCCSLTWLKRGMLTVGGFLLAAGMGWTTTAPTDSARSAMRAGWDMWPSRGEVSGSRDAFLKAGASDPYDPEPWRLFAQLEYQAWLQNSETPAAFEGAIEAWNRAAQRDPWSSTDDLRRAEAFWARYQKTEVSDFARDAVLWYERADAKRPHDERILSELAFAAEAAGMLGKSKKAAESAIKIHELSRNNGHWEKLLPDEMLERLSVLMDE